MSTLSQALSIALSGLQTTTSLITLTSKNISNAQTTGYTAKTANVQSVDYGSSFGGSSVAGYSRASNQALTNDYNLTTSDSSYYSSLNTYMTQVQTMLDSSSSTPTLSADVAAFASAWTQYSSSPESAVNKTNVITTAETMVNDINSVSGQIQTLSAQVQSDIKDGVTSLNSDLKQIAKVNQAIQTASAAGQPTVDLQDQLDTLVNDVSKYVSVSVQSRANGQIALYTPSGQLLVDSSAAQQFTTTSTSTGMAILNTNGTNVTNSFTGGSLQAGLDFIDTSSTAAASTQTGVGVLAKLQAQLSTLTSAFTSTSSTSSFASTYAAAVTSSTAAGATQAGDTLASSFFTTTNGFAVNANLVNGTAGLPQTGVQAVADSFNSTASYSTSGLSATNVTYTSLVSSILSSFQQTANTVSAQNTSATSQKSYYQQTLSNSTGVNIDTELANLVAYQNSYAASAHVMTSVNQMLTTLMSVLQ